MATKALTAAAAPASTECLYSIPLESEESNIYVTVPGSPETAHLEDSYVVMQGTPVEAYQNGLHGQQVEQAKLVEVDEKNYVLPRPRRGINTTPADQNVYCMAGDYDLPEVPAWIAEDRLYPT